LLAAKHGFTRVILGCRNESKGKAAIESLVSQTGLPESTFELLIMDTSDAESCKAAAGNVVGGIDAVVLNAGGVMGDGRVAPKGNGMNSHMAVNLQGNFQLLDGLITHGKLSKDASIVYAGSEAARGVSIMAMPCPLFKDHDTKEFTSVLDGTFFGTKFLADTAYGYVFVCLTT
jgi:NAD(P)-dependent dehydrogenase (short-subunit alcohol dehydrogenase family)